MAYEALYAMTSATHPTLWALLLESWQPTFTRIATRIAIPLASLYSFIQSLIHSENISWGFIGCQFLCWALMIK